MPNPKDSIQAVQPYINPPKRIPFPLNIAVSFSERKAKRKLDIARILTWMPKFALSSGIMEALVSHPNEIFSQRMLQLVRLQVAYMVACPMCVQMNTSATNGISDAETEMLKRKLPPESLSSISAKEALAINYVRSISETPIKITPKFVDELKASFSEREIVVLATTAAQVNYWSRLQKSLGIEP